VNEKFNLIVRQILGSLAAGDYESIVSLTKGVRMSCDDIASAIRDVRGTLGTPPDDAFRAMDIVEAMGATIPQFSVRMPLWTQEDGRSDLTMELTIKLRDGIPEVELDDIHVQ
jgi:hypothetical protein